MTTLLEYAKDHDVIVRSFDADSVKEITGQDSGDLAVGAIDLAET
jgi:hypothetical protein